MDIKKKKKIIGFEVTTEEVHDYGNMLEKLVDYTSENNNVKGVIADGWVYVP